MRWFLIVLFLTSSNSAVAQIVRGGEHPNFTRIVISLPLDTVFEIGRVDAGYLVRLDERVDFDLSRAFELIPRERVRDLISSDSGLLISSDCECHIDVFRVNSIQIAIDIADGPAPDDLAFVLSFDETSVEPGDEISIAETDRSPQGPSSPTEMSETEPSAQFPVVFDTPRQELPVPIPNTRFAVENQDNSTSGNGVDGARDEVLSTISRGAAQGVVQPVRSPVDEQPDAGVGNSSTSEATLSLPSIDLPMDDLPIRAITAFDREQELALAGVAQTNIGGPCILDERVSIADWVAEGDPFAQIAALEGSLFDARDNTDPQVATNLARLYISLSFGSEARAILGLVPEAEDAGLLLHLASAVEGRQSDPLALASQIECDSAIALWALLSIDDASPDLALQPEPILRAFAFLPPRIKAAVAGRLVDQFRRAGELDAARQVLRSTESDVPEDLTDHEVAEAAIMVLDGETQEASEELAAAAFDPIQGNPEALAALIEVRLSEGQPVSSESLALAEALASELRGSDISIRLKTAEMRGRLAAGELRRVHSFLRETDEVFDPIWSELLLAMTRQADLDDFLVFSAVPPEVELSAVAGNAAARRLIDAGVPSLASGYVQSQVSGRDGIERQLLRAEIAALSGDYPTTAAILGELDDPQAEALRLLAAERSRDPDQIVEVAEDTETGPTAAQIWRSGQWDGLMEETEFPVLQSAAELMVSRSESESPVLSIDANGPGTLEQRRELVASSSSARETVTALLEQFPAPLED